MVETVTASTSRGGLQRLGVAPAAQWLDAVELERINRFRTGTAELDRVLGGGLRNNFV